MNALIQIPDCFLLVNTAPVTSGFIAPSFSNREAWLSAFIRFMRPVFAAAGATLPDKIRVSCGFPKGSSTAIGEIWSAIASADGTREIFISPTLSDSLRVCDVVIHELCHAALPEGAGHGPKFKRLAHKLGLTGKMTATIASPELAAALTTVIPIYMGEYPHSPLSSLNNGIPKQTTRLIKLQCNSCEMVVRTTRKWLEEVGAPICACGGEFI